MKISKRDALMWFEFFAQLPEDEALMPKQQEIVLATYAQIERAVDKRIFGKDRAYYDGRLYFALCRGTDGKAG